jgi:hypothetical protein
MPGLGLPFMHACMHACIHSFIPSFIHKGIFFKSVTVPFSIETEVGPSKHKIWYKMEIIKQTCD